MLKTIFFLLLMMAMGYCMAGGNIPTAQLRSFNNDSLIESIKKSQAEIDSLNQRLNNYYQQQINKSYYTDTNALNRLVTEINEQQGTARRNMWLRLGFGCFMLFIVLPLGIMRQIKLRKRRQQPPPQ